MSVYTRLEALFGEAPVELGPMEKKLRELSADSGWVEAYIPERFEDREYRRHVLFTGQGFEVVLVVWPPDSLTLPHDHGGRGEGLATVLRGPIFSENYVLKSHRVPLCMDEAREYRTGEMLQVPRGLIHRMGNRERQAAVSLHLYLPIIKEEEVTFYDPETLLPMVEEPCKAG